MHDYVDKLIIIDKPGYNNVDIENLALNYVVDVDYIICCGDIDTSRFPKSKIIGNKDTGAVNDKYKLYKKLHKNFLMPDTYLVSSMDEADEIVQNYPDKRFITKPVNGSGGKNIKWFDARFEYDDKFLLQEFVDGNSVSTSFLAYPDHSTTMVTSSDQIIAPRGLDKSDFSYCGNITPCINHIDKLENISQKIARMYKLVGSNGVDFIIKDNKAYVIEVNPRIQGTFECVENSYNMNMAQAHIDACSGIEVQMNPVSSFCVKLIVFSQKKACYDLRNIDCVHDLCDMNYVYDVGDPIATLVVSDKILENAMSRTRSLQNLIYNSSF